MAKRIKKEMLKNTHTHNSMTKRSIFSIVRFSRRCLLLRITNVNPTFFECHMIRKTKFEIQKSKIEIRNCSIEIVK